MIKNLVPRLAEVGKIKIGGKGKECQKKDGGTFRMPVKLDHFIITTTQKVDDEFVPDTTLMERIAKTTGQSASHLTRLPVRLLYDDPTLNFPTSYAAYTVAGCICRGDGETAQRTGIATPVACPCERRKPDYKGSDKCKATGILSVVLDTEKIGGVWKFRTTSINSIVNIMSSLDFLRSFTHGTLAGVPFDLVLSSKTVQVEGKQATVYVCHLEFNGSAQKLAELAYEEVQRRQIARLRMEDVEAAARAALAIPELPDIEREITEEFYPENIVADEHGNNGKGVNGLKSKVARTYTIPPTPPATGDEPPVDTPVDTPTPPATPENGNTKVADPEPPKKPTKQLGPNANDLFAAMKSLPQTERRTRLIELTGKASYFDLTEDEAALALNKLQSSSAQQPADPEPVTPSHALPNVQALKDAMESVFEADQISDELFKLAGVRSFEDVTDDAAVSALSSLASSVMTEY